MTRVARPASVFDHQDTDQSEPVDIVWERLFYEIRRGRGAAATLQAGISGPGAIAEYQAWVAQPMPGAQSRCLTWPVRSALEPGAFMPVGIHKVPWELHTTEGLVKGTWVVVVGDQLVERLPPDQEIPTWVASQVPSVLRLSANEPNSLRRQAARVVRAGEMARDTATRMGIAMVQRIIAGHKTHMAHLGPAFDEQDALQAGMTRLIQNLDHFASPGRPACSWTWSCMTDINRDLQRAMAHGDNESYALAAVRSWLWTHPLVRTVAQARQAGLRRYSDNTVKLALHRPFGTVSLSTWTARTQDQQEQGTDDRLGALGQQDDRLASDPTAGRALLELLARLNPPIGPADAEPWLYKVGALDYPHTPGEVRARYGKSGANKAASVERRFFAPFVRHGEDWGRADDRARIRARAKAALVAEHALIVTETGDEYMDRQLRNKPAPGRPGPGAN